MSSTTSRPGTLAEIARGVQHWLRGWWQVIHLGAVLLVLALSPTSYTAPRRAALARHMVLGTAPALPWFTVLSSLISLIVIRIVLVTALSYGLTQYALEMVVRVLVLELIPLTAALFAALRCTIPFSVQIDGLRNSGRWQAQRDPMRDEVLPRVIAGLFCALMLAAVSCVVTLLLAYLSVYGFTTSGFSGYTHTVGHVFNGAVSLIFVLKIFLLGCTVALLPIATVLDDTRAQRGGVVLPRPTGPQPEAEGFSISAELHGLVRMFLVILLIEAASLVGNYY